jgi:hypothetical protein
MQGHYGPHEPPPLNAWEEQFVLDAIAAYRSQGFSLDAATRMANKDLLNMHKEF